MPEKSLNRHVVSANVSDFEKQGTGLKRHYVYTVRVTWSDDSKLLLYRTYLEFFNLHVEVVKLFPIEAGVIHRKDKVLPQLPRKFFIGRANVRKVAEIRREALDKYLEEFLKLEKKIVTCPPAREFFKLRPTDLNPQSKKDKTGGRKSPFAFFKEKVVSKTHNICGEISGPMHLEQYRAISNYKKNNREQIDLVTDKEYEVITKDTSGWWLVKKDEMEGWVPASYLEPVHHNPEVDVIPKSDESEQVISIKEFKSSGEFKDELSFPVHAVMKVIYKTLDGWWYVRYNEINGYVPAAYLKPLKDTQTFDNEAKTPRVVDTAIPQEDAKCEEAVGLAAKKKFFGAPPRRESLLNVHTIHAPVKARHEMEEPAIQEEQEKDDDELEEEEQDGSVGNSDELVEAEPYRAAAEYVAASDEEVNLQIGDQVDVITKDDSGWWYVCVNDDSTGWAPATYLESVNVDDENERDRKKLQKNISQDSEAEFEKYVSVEEHIAQDEDEISFPKGVIITILQKYMDGWWYASYNEQNGYVPSSLLEPPVDTTKADKVDMPAVKVSKPSFRKHMVPRRGTIDNFNTIFAAMNNKDNNEKIIEEQEEERAGGDVSPRGRTVSNASKLHSSGAKLQEERFSADRMGSGSPKDRTVSNGRKHSFGGKPQVPPSRPPQQLLPQRLPPRPTPEQLQRCTGQVRVVYGKGETQVVRPIPVRPGGVAQHLNSCPLSPERFRPVSPRAFGDSNSENSDEWVSSSELSPNTPIQSGDKPTVPIPRRAPEMPVQSNIDANTCGLLQDPSCSTGKLFRPRSPSSPGSLALTLPKSPSSPRSPAPTLPKSRSVSSVNSPTQLSPASAPPALPPSRRISVGTSYQQKEVYYV